jgi:hypothetical protein
MRSYARTLRKEGIDASGPIGAQAPAKEVDYDSYLTEEEKEELREVRRLELERMQRRRKNQDARRGIVRAPENENDNEGSDDSEDMASDEEFAARTKRPRPAVAGSDDEDDIDDDEEEDDDEEAGDGSVSKDAAKKKEKKEESLTGRLQLPKIAVKKAKSLRDMYVFCSLYALLLHMCMFILLSPKLYPFFLASSGFCLARKRSSRRSVRSAPRSRPKRRPILRPRSWHRSSVCSAATGTAPRPSAGSPSSRG